MYGEQVFFVVRGVLFAHLFHLYFNLRNYLYFTIVTLASALFLYWVQIVVKGLYELHLDSLKRLQ